MIIRLILNKDPTYNYMISTCFLSLNYDAHYLREDHLVTRRFYKHQSVFLLNDNS